MRQASRPLCCAVLCRAVLCLRSGCNRSTLQSDAASLFPGPTSQADPSGQRVQVHDFGLVLAHGQTLRHDFILTNPTSHPIRLLKATTSAPCCSAIGPLPKSIPPDSAVPVPIVLKTTNKLGLLRIIFGVETDSAIAPVRRLAGTVRLIPEWEVEAQEELTNSLALGKAGKLACRFACRQSGSEGRGLPENVKVSGPIKAVLKGRAIAETSQPGGMIERRCQVDVELLPSSRPGRQQGDYFFTGLTAEIRATSSPGR